MFLFFFHATATTEIYTLSLHDALPIFTKTNRSVFIAPRATDEDDDPLIYELMSSGTNGIVAREASGFRFTPTPDFVGDRKSTRLNSSHSQISYAVFCLKKKQEEKQPAA